MKIKKGVNVVVDKNKFLKLIKNNIISSMPIWVSNDIYTVIEVNNKDKILLLDRNLKNTEINKIHLNHIKPLKDARKEKLKILNNFKE